MPEWFEDWWPIVIVVVGAVWGAYTYFDKRRRDASAKAPSSGGSVKVTASEGGVAAGGDMTGNTITTNRTADEPRQ